VTPLEIRFDQALDQAGMEAKALADMMGISKQTLSALKKGRLLGKQHWPTIARILHVDHDWLVSGHGQIPAWWIDPATGAPSTPVKRSRPMRLADEAPPAPQPATPPAKRGRPRKEPPDPHKVLIDQQQSFIAALQATIERLSAENQALRAQCADSSSALKPTGSTP
jgi:transcriptional regulator with XRE-family HTH domain